MKVLPLLSHVHLERSLQQLYGSWIKAENSSKSISLIQPREYGGFSSDSGSADGQEGTYQEYGGAVREKYGVKWKGSKTDGRKGGSVQNNVPMRGCRGVQRAANVTGREEDNN